MTFNELPPEDLKWEGKKTAKPGPKLDYEDHVDYLVHTKAYDGKAMKSFRALYGYNYVQNGWMGDSWSLECDGMKYIKAKISPSHPGIGRKDYNTWIAVSADCSIETGHCTCPAVNARSCSHISAIIYAITLAWANGYAGETSTDKKRVRGRRAAQVLSHDMISDMVFDRPSPFELKLNSDKSNEKAATDKPTPIQQFINHSDLQEFVSNSAVKDIWECQGTMLYKMLHAPEESKCPADEIPHQEYTLDSANPILMPLSCNKCQFFFNEKYVQISRESRSNLEQATKTQNTNVWTDSRKLRIKSSRVSDLPKTQRADPNKFVNNHIYPRF